VNIVGLRGEQGLKVEGFRWLFDLWDADFCWEVCCIGVGVRGGHFGEAVVLDWVISMIEG